MKVKWQLVLFLDLMLLLSNLVIGCSTTPAESSHTPMIPTKLSIMVYPPGAGVVSAMVSPPGAGVVSADVSRRTLTIVPPEGNVYERDTPLMLMATPAEGFTFAYWEGDRFSYWNSNFPSAVSSPTTWWLIMNYHKTIIAQFTEVSSPISEVTVSSVTESKAYLDWDIQEGQEGYPKIEYGLTQNYGNIRNEIQGITGHRCQLSELKPETLYHFRIRYVNKDGVEFLSNDYVFTTRKVEDLVSAMLYPVRTVGYRGGVTHLGSTIFNDSSQTITVDKMEIYNESSDIEYAISESGFIKAGSAGSYNEVPTIKETWGSGKVSPRSSLSVSGWMWEPPSSKEEILEWRVEWYCIAANGEEFTITGEFSSFVDFFNWVTK